MLNTLSGKDLIKKSGLKRGTEYLLSGCNIVFDPDLTQPKELKKIIFNGEKITYNDQDIPLTDREKVLFIELCLNINKEVFSSELSNYLGSRQL